jgi:hypothetical protein
MNKELKDTLTALTDSYKIEIRYLDEAIQRVRDLHVADYDNACQICIKGLDYDSYEAIYEEYPCPTIKALDGEQ